MDKCNHAHGCREHTGGGTMSEPRVDDPIATGEADVCRECEHTHEPYDECFTNEPDEMWDSIFEE